MRREISTSIIGVFLIFAGLWFILNRITNFPFNWGNFYLITFIFLGILLLISGYTRRLRGKVFLGTVLFLIGLLFLFRSPALFFHFPFFIFRTLSLNIWPLLLVIIGLGFIALYFLNPKDLGIIIPAVIFLVLGFLSYFYFNRFYYWEMWNFIKIFWPTVIILTGIVFILSSFIRRVRLKNNFENRSARKFSPEKIDI